MNLHTLRDDELLRHAHLQLDELTSTPLEKLLLERFGALLDKCSKQQDALDVLRGFEIDVALTKDIERLEAALQFEQDFDLKNTRAHMDVLTEHDIDDPVELGKRLKACAELDDLLQDLAAPIARLNTLANPATEAAATTA
jgi:hypothetical protein